MPGPSQHPAVRFGSFEVNPRTGELRKQGIRIKLHEKPFQVLLALIEHPGEVVTRKELQERLWPEDTFVEFENGLNNTIFFFSSRRRHTRSLRDWSSDVCSSD